MRNGKDDAYFRAEANWFVGNGAARGPWSEDACHAGPVTGMFARAIERAAPDRQLTRLTANFSRPIPLSGFRIATKIQRAGRQVAEVRATLTDLDDRVCAAAFGLLVAVHAYEKMPTSSVAGPVLADAIPGRFPVERANHALPFFGDSINVAYPPGETGGPGPTTLWMRALPPAGRRTPEPVSVDLPHCRLW